MPRQSGFTLIELMIVVAILGILLAIAIPAYNDYTIRTKISEGLSVAVGAKSAVSESRLSEGRFPDSNADAGVGTGISSNYVRSLEVGTSGTITITYQNVEATLEGSTVIMEPSFVGRTVRWDCSLGTVPSRHRPAACR